jgi:uncharacterized protein YkwD
MAPLQRWHLSISALLVAGSLVGCGGGGGGGASATPAPPQLGSNTATQGFEWINVRRAQIGLAALTRSSVIDKAAQSHSDYQVANNVISHTEVAGKAGFTGAGVFDRLQAAGYSVTAPYAFGEVISRTGNVDGANMAEELITAIYHRFAIFEPKYKEAGSGAAISKSSEVYFTTNFGASNGYGVGIGRGKIVSYPFADQSAVPISFSSNSETPDPVPNKDVVGYPISVHADLSGTLAVRSFTVRMRGAGADLPVRLLSAVTDPETKLAGAAAAAIIPLDPLLAATTYDVSFVGVVDSVDVPRNWSFTTK